MRRLGRAWLAIGMAAAALALAPPPAHACSCAPGSPAEHFSYADAVFEGVATKRTPPAGAQPQPDTIVYTVDVDRIDKGEVTDPQEVKTHRDGATCGTSFEIGRRYRVYANREEGGGLRTTLCSGNTEAPVGPTTSVRPTTTQSPMVTTTTRPTTTSGIGATTTSTTETPPTTTTSTTALAIKPSSDDANDDDAGGGRGPLAAVAALGVLGAGIAVLGIRRYTATRRLR